MEEEVVLSVKMTIRQMVAESVIKTGLKYLFFAFQSSLYYLDEVKNINNFNIVPLGDHFAKTVHFCWDLGYSERSDFLKICVKSSHYFSESIYENQSRLARWQLLSVSNFYGKLSKIHTYMN